MKKDFKFIMALIGLVFLAWYVTFQCDDSFGKFYGEFGDGTSKSDTVYIDFTSWDTLGYSTDADTYFVRRYYHGTLIDSTFGVAATNRERTGYYVLAKRALNSTNYGQYGVEIEWHKQTKVFKTSGTYIVRDGDVENAPQNIQDLKGSLVGDDSLKIIYMSTWGNGGNDGLSPFTPVCSLRTAEQKCTGAKEYKIMIAAGDYSSQCCSADIWPLTIEGAGWDRTILNGVSGEAIIKVDHTGRGFKVSGLSFVHDGAVSSHGIYLFDIEGFEIDDCYFEKCSYSIHCPANSEKGRISDVFAYASALDGIKVTGDRIWIDHNVIDSLGNSIADGIVFLAASDHSIASNNIVVTKAGYNFRGNETFVNNYGWNPTRANIFYDVTGAKMMGNHESSYIDTTNTVEKDIYAVYADADSALDATQALLKFYGIFPDSGYAINWPPDGSGNKDSTQSFDKEGNWMGSITFRHHNTDAVIDTFVTKIEGY